MWTLNIWTKAYFHVLVNIYEFQTEHLKCQNITHTYIERYNFEQHRNSRALGINSTNAKPFRRPHSSLVAAQKQNIWQTILTKKFEINFCRFFVPKRFAQNIIYVQFVTISLSVMGLLPDTQNWGLHMSRECRERFSRHRALAIPTCITARAWRTRRDACRDH